ncbi:MAG: allantoinase PuuE [Neomegalonema sp.]|nr:allantoinase PuuE [Neomegalonema sp.]
MTRYIRDMGGYGAEPPHPQWPGGARIAVQFVLNYEEGGENCLLHGDSGSEAFLSEIVPGEPWPGQRHWNMETIYEYGARAGFWRVRRIFDAAAVPVTVYGVATALARSPEQVAAMKASGWEIASHGLKWIEYKDFSPEEERAHIREAIRLHTEVVGAPPLGWYTGRCSNNTIDLAAEEGDFAYFADSYADDLPYWRRAAGQWRLITPYTLDANDMRFANVQGFNSGDQFFTYLKDSFDCLYAEGAAGAPKMLSIGLHCRLVGRPGRAEALRRFIEYAQGREKVWFARRIDIANHWRAHHPAPTGAAPRPSEMNREAFVSAYGGIFEHSPWIAERAFTYELGPAHDCAAGVHSALCRAFRAATEAERLGVLRAHPDLAGKLAQARRLTAESTAEQASAGLDALTEEERAAFTQLNTDYVAKFGFPFIIAVRDHDKAGIMAAFQRRLQHDRPSEFAEACRQVERIAELRLQAEPGFRP